MKGAAVNTSPEHSTQLAPTLRVLMSPGASVSNPYVRLLIESTSAEAEVSEFNFKRAFLGRYDVLHVHWPDGIVRSPKWYKSQVKGLLFLLLCGVNIVRRRAHVWTVHNRRPHESVSAVCRLALSAFSHSCSVHIYLSRADVPIDPRKRVVVRHPDYRPLVPRCSPPADREQGRLLLFGRLRPYKGIEVLANAVERLGMPEMRLRVVGRGLSEAYESELVDSISGLERTTLRLEHLSDEHLLHEIRRAEYVVLPYLRMGNSGAALLSLTAGTPVLATRSPVLDELRAEVGEAWVELIDGSMSTSKLESGIERLRAAPRARVPNLEARSWSAAGEAHVRAYIWALQSARSNGRQVWRLGRKR